MSQVEKKKNDWEESALGQFDKEGKKYESFVNNSLGLDKQATNVSGGKKTESTHSSKDRLDKTNTVA